MKYLRKLNNFMESLPEWIFWTVMLFLAAAINFVFLGGMQ